MGLGPIKSGIQQVITPRNGKNWCDVVNTEPLPKRAERCVMVLGRCNADGSNFKPYDKPVIRAVGPA